MMVVWREAVKNIQFSGKKILTTPRLGATIPEENKEGRMHPPHLQRQQRGQQQETAPYEGVGFGYAGAFGIRVFIFEWRCFGH